MLVNQLINVHPFYLESQADIRLRDDLHRVGFDVFGHCFRSGDHSTVSGHWYPIPDSGHPALWVHAHQGRSGAAQGATDQRRHHRIPDVGPWDGTGCMGRAVH